VGYDFTCNSVAVEDSPHEGRSRNNSEELEERYLCVSTGRINKIRFLGREEGVKNRDASLGLKA